jgi:hypothetical protein
MTPIGNGSSPLLAKPATRQSVREEKEEAEKEKRRCQPMVLADFSESRMIGHGPQAQSLAAKLRAETTVTLSGIALRLRMGVVI